MKPRFEGGGIDPVPAPLSSAEYPAAVRDGRLSFIQQLEDGPVELETEIPLSGPTSPPRRGVDDLEPGNVIERQPDRHALPIYIVAGERPIVLRERDQLLAKNLKVLLVRLFFRLLD